MAKGERILELDGLRGIAILSVFVHHALHVPLLWMGVDLFFVLSGFLITGILIERKNRGGSYFGHFYERRARRILVPYAMLMVISSLLFDTQWMNHWYWYVFFGTNFASVLDQAGHPSLQPLWSLAVEEQFYLVWPVLILLVSEQTLFPICIAMLFTAPLLRGLATPLFSTHFPIYFLTPFRMDLLFAGALIALLRRNRPDLLNQAGRVAPIGGIAALAVFMWLTRYPWFRTSGNTVASNMLIYSLSLLLVSALLLMALSGAGWVCSFLRLRLLRFVGVISYSMYLIHMTAIILAERITPNRALTFLIALAITLGYSILSWYGIERRLLRR